MEKLKLINIFLLILLVGIIAVWALNIKNDNNTIKYKDTQIESLQKQIIKSEFKLKQEEYNTNYNSCLLYLMYSEDLLLKPNNELTGQYLIGFGHAVKKDENFNTMNYRIAFDLLQIDFIKCIEEAIRLGFKEKNNKQLAVALMVYNMKSKSVKKIIADSCSTIDRYIYFIKIQNGDTIIKTSPNIANNRAFEKALYYCNGFINVYEYLP